MRIGKIAQVMALAVGCTRQAVVEAPKPAAPVASTPEPDTTVELPCMTWVSYCEDRKWFTCEGDKARVIDCQELCRSSWDRDGTCGKQENGQTTCLCCDVGEPGCAAKLGP